MILDPDNSDPVAHTQNRVQNRPARIVYLTVTIMLLQQGLPVHQIAQHIGVGLVTISKVHQQYPNNVQDTLEDDRVVLDELDIVEGKWL